MGPEGRLIAGPDFLDMPIARLTLDVTETLATGKWTGIERVVRRLAVELVNSAEGVPPVRLVAAIGGRFHELNATGRDRLFNPGAKVGNNAHAVGNGGFSLRSRTLLEALQDPQIVASHPEDTAICRTHREYLEREHGIAFAPATVADQFSFEHVEPRGPSFGFHGQINITRFVDDKAIRMLELR